MISTAPNTMKRCAFCIKKAKPFAPIRQGHTYSRASLTKEALAKKVQAGFGDDQHGQSVRVNQQDKTISTAVGDLPMSPVFDADWMKARRRQEKDAPSAPTGRFRRKLHGNPFARALATPMRRCPITETIMPRYFLQDFGVVKHPETGAPWFAPEKTSYEFVEPTKRTSDTEQTPEKPQNKEVPIKAYVVCRKSTIDSIGQTKSKSPVSILAQRNGMSVTPAIKAAVFREDMGDFLLNTYRNKVVSALIPRSEASLLPPDKFIQACSTWDEIKNVTNRGCVLWLPEQTEDDASYATFDVEEAKFGSKLAVHNLYYLLGKEQVISLKASSPLFADNEILVLKQWKSESMMRLHMLLWRLQGYLAKP